MDDLYAAIHGDDFEGNVLVAPIWFTRKQVLKMPKDIGFEVSSSDSSTPVLTRLKDFINEQGKTLILCAKAEKVGRKYSWTYEFETNNKFDSSPSLDK